jgi:hypothetical protein
MNALINPTDLFLFQHRASDLYQLEMQSSSTKDSIGIRTEKDFFIHLQSAEVDLTVHTAIHYTTLEDSKLSAQMHFDIGQEVFISKVFTKFLEWDTLATTNHAENFKKEMARRPLNKAVNGLKRQLYPEGCTYKFVWESGKGQLSVSDSAPYSGIFDKEDVLHFRSLLNLLPDMKDKLAAAVRDKEVQKQLFK